MGGGLFSVVIIGIFTIKAKRGRRTTRRSKPVTLVDRGSTIDDGGIHLNNRRRGGGDLEVFPFNNKDWQQTT